MATYYCYHDSPIGRILLAGDGNALTLLGFPKGSMARRHEQGWIEDPRPFRQAVQQLEQYFDGKLETFDLPLAATGTQFQQSVWRALREIPYGETWSYARLASHIGKPKAPRAVGAANALNPIPIIVPCHRVIGSSGKLTGFGGGLETKQFLLNLESKIGAFSLNTGQ